jgi:hypothetical protein
MIGFGVALYFLVARFFWYLIGLTVNTLFFICVIFYIGRKIEVFTGLILSIVDELLILINTNLMKRQGSSISVYQNVQCGECGSKIRKPLF